MLLFSKPDSARTHAFLEFEKKRPFSYPDTGRTRYAETVRGYDNDHNSIELGAGDAAWAAAKEAIRQWRMFPGGWASVSPNGLPVQEGVVVAMTARVLGLWWLNSCRIVYVLDEENRFGFAYGTLPGHVESGEELFLVEKTVDGRVRYSLRAFSRPRHWLARLGYPLARMYQRKFVQESKQSMLHFVQNQLS
ncbi:MAG: DUF1990 domain-containing protein [Lewinellaceae bacterium]|nr:DUF1990 domain-containing protein [Lewinellaceae bacterium]